LTADLQAPDFETRVAILKQKALLENFHLPEEVSHLIAERISSNVRELEGALTRLHAVSTIQHVEISMDMARMALKPLLQPKVINITVDDIKKAVASHFNIKVSEIISKRRTKNLSFPRHIAMYLCRKHTTASYPEIGEHFGGRDHSSVIHAATVVSSKLSTDAQVKVLVEEDMGGTTYSIQYTTDSKETLQRYYDEDAPRLREEGLRLFGDKMLAFRTELELISEH
jgi:chromosomal replication initiator protein